MSEQGAPRVESARYVIPFEADTTALEAALEQIGKQADAIGERLKKAVSSVEAPPIPADGARAVVQAVQPPPVSSDARGADELQKELRKNTEAIEELRGAVEEMTAAVLSMSISQGL